MTAIEELDLAEEPTETEQEAPAADVRQELAASIERRYSKGLARQWLELAARHADDDQAAQLLRMLDKGPLTTLSRAVSDGQFVIRAAGSGWDDVEIRGPER